MSVPRVAPKIRPMREGEHDYLHAIHAVCHPTFPPRPWRWFEAHPTLVLEVDLWVVGYTSYSVVVQPNISTAGEIMIGYGIDIKPGYQGRGYGRLLCDARLDVARAVGAKVFVGHAAPDNIAMIRLFEEAGFTRMHEVPDGYPDGGTMLLFMGPIR